MHQEMISVIIPVYNVRDYFENCIDSVTKQNYQNLEIIVVDDGSTDGSGELCDVIGKNDSRITVIHQENQGLSVARNTGLNIAHGEWIAFLDSDDWIEPTMYSELIRLAHEHNADLVSCATHCCESEDTVVPVLDGNIVTLKGDQIIRALISTEVLRFEVWNKLWKKELIESVRFVPKQISEDVHFDRLVFSKADKIVHINKVLHNYRVNRPGNTNSSFKINRLCIFDEFDQWYSELINAGKEEPAAMIATIAAQFAIHIYEDAIVKKQANFVKQELIRHFYLNHNRTKGYHYYYDKYAIKSRIMSKSPALYELIWKIRTLKLK